MQKKHWQRLLTTGLIIGAACWPLGSVTAASSASTATTKTTTSPAPATTAAAATIRSTKPTTDKTYSLTFAPDEYTEEHMSYQGQDVAYRAYRGIVYVAHPAAPEAEQMNIFIPSAYFTGGSVNGYTAQTAPIFLPNGVGGYMPGQAGEPALSSHGTPGPNAIWTALSRGYVVAAPAIRGRTTQDAQGNYVGKAPALIVDYKAAVRYLRHNRHRLPAGDTEKIISDGTSAGGALSALLGATGNSPDYAPYLQALGAADERDDIFASMDYCPITNLEHADMAYEWMFAGVNTYHQGNAPHAAQPTGQLPLPPQGSRPGISQIAPPPDTGTVTNRPANAPQETTTAQTMTGRQITASHALKQLFPAYVNSLGLHDTTGQPLTLRADGMGSFADYIKSIYRASAQKALTSGNTSVQTLDWLTVKQGQVTAVDLSKYAVWAGRLKATPAFDKFDLSSGENDEFADRTNQPKHFTAFSYQHSDKQGALADATTIRLLNPMQYIGTTGVTVAPHWRIRHGAKDRDTCLAIPALLALKLQNAGYDVDFAAPWGQGHAGDYDLKELFDWTDNLCK